MHKNIFVDFQYLTADIKLIAAVFSEGNKLQLLCLHFVHDLFQVSKICNYFFNYAVKKVCNRTLDKNLINAKGAKTAVHKNRMFAKLEDILEFFTLVALLVLGHKPFNPEHKGVVLELASCKWTGVT